MAAPKLTPAQIEEKRAQGAKLVTSMFPKIPKVTTVLLEFFIKRESKISLLREPLAHYCQESVVLHAQDIFDKTNKQVVTYQDTRDWLENLFTLHAMVLKKEPGIAKELGDNIRKFVLIISEYATSLEKVCDVNPTDWMGLSDMIIEKTAKLDIGALPNFTSFIPKMAQFQPIKLLGAGGFGAVYKATFKPGNFTTTVKLVATTCFQRHKQACVDKVVASMIRSPFLVKYYSCFCTKDAYITVMEYICGIDLMRVVDKAVYLPTDPCRTVMAQLILALEHMHLRGILHRDIKVSNMLIIPGGRVKTIDFDTNKVCVGHFSRRVMKGYFAKTAVEFHDGECAGTVPYMAPEVLKRFPYGRSCDWWSSGVTFFKMMTGRVPFRGEGKDELKEKICNTELKWPEVKEHPQSATPEAKNMVEKMLRKNATERLGSLTYAEIKNHEHYRNYNWKRLAMTKEVANIPAIADIMGGKGKQAGKADHLTVGATSNTLKRKLMKMEDMKDVESSAQRPLYTFSAPSWKKLITKTKDKQMNVGESFMKTSGMEEEDLDYRKMSDQDVNVGIVGLMAGQKQTALQKEKMDVIVFRHKSMGKYWGFGMSVCEVMGEENKKFFMVDRVMPGSDAERSHVLEGDVVVAVNNQDISALTAFQVNTMFEKAGEQLVLTVLASSAFRLLESRKDIDQILKQFGRDTISLKGLPGGCLGGGGYGFKTFEAKAWNDGKKQFVHCHIVLKVEGAQITTPSKFLYPGDVVVAIEGQQVEVMTPAAIAAALGGGKPEISITIAPISPVRIKRPSFTRMHETVLDDEKGDQK